MIRSSPSLRRPISTKSSLAAFQTAQVAPRLLLYPCRSFAPSRIQYYTLSATPLLAHNRMDPDSSVSTIGSTSLDFNVIKYITAKEAAAIDADLMSPDGCGYMLPQLMELAGFACARAIQASYPPSTHPRLVVAAGPGNQGGDGLVAARHAKLWGYSVNVWYPKQGKTDIFKSLRKQLEVMQVPFLDDDEFEDALEDCDVVLDAIFGFSFKGPPRAPFARALEILSSESRFEFIMRSSRPPIVSVDIPSGWSVDDGDLEGSSASKTILDQPDPERKTFTPEVVISLTAPKKGLKNFHGLHFLGGRFVPPAIIDKYGLLGLDSYEWSDQIVNITGWTDVDDLEEGSAGSQT